MVQVSFIVYDGSTTLISTESCCSIANKTLGRTQNSIDFVVIYILDAFNKWLTVLKDELVLLAHRFVESAPLRVMTDTDTWGEGKVKAHFFHTLFSPISKILKVLLVMRARKSNIVWKYYITQNMLISMVGIRTEQKLDFILLFICGRNLNS